MAGLLLAGLRAQAVYVSAPSMLTDEPLVIIRAADFTDGGTQAVAVSAGPAAADGPSVPVAGPVQASFRVRQAGDYELWVRVGQVSGDRAALKVELVRDGKVLCKGLCHDGLGEPGRGGLNAYRDYEARAARNTPKKTAISDLAGAMTHQGNVIVPRSDDPNDADAGALADDLMTEFQKNTADRWVSLLRLEKPGANKFYWWSLGRSALEPGRHELRVAPAAGKAATNAMPLVHLAFLSASREIAYPCLEDLSAPRASYVRFRIDQAPTSGVALAASIYTHTYCYPPHLRSDTYHFTPDGLKSKPGSVHRDTGFTRWYCLQDMGGTARIPPPKYRGEVGFQLSVKAAGPARGATQFAMYPFAASVIREVAWDEPAGRNVAMLMDFEAHPERLRTFRENAREHYEQARQAAGGRLFPLTRNGLWLKTNGGESPDCEDYMRKTLRLFGLNTVGGDLDACRRYGWMGFTGAARMDGFLPFDEDLARRQYEDYYANLANPKTREVFQNVPARQMVDEPGEQGGTALSAPLWTYEPGTNGAGRYVDYAGGSEYYTRLTNYPDCVFEGRFRKKGGTIELRAAVDNPADPQSFVYWRIGKVLPDHAPENVMAGRGHDKGVAFVHKAAMIRDEPVSFKIVREKTRLGLFLNDTIVYIHENVPLGGGFGLASAPKEFSDLNFRLARPADRLTESGGDLSLETRKDGSAAGGSADAGLEGELGLAELPDWARPKPLKDRIEQDWVVAGGIPGAHEGFRRWAAGQGATPDLFGKSSWDDVRILTVRNLVANPQDARRYYWGRRYSGWLTPRMWALAQDGTRAHFPNPEVLSYVGLSGGYLNVYQCIIVDMFRMAGYTNGLMPGISDWHTGAAPSPQVNAYAAAFFNAGARRYGREPASKIMMHCVAPSTFRAYTMLANNVKYISYYNFGPHYCANDAWSDRYACYDAVCLLNNRVTQADDIAIPGLMRPSRVALLYSMSSEYWGPNNFGDKRAAFLALSHEYFQPELVNEDHVAEGALDHFDALVLLDPTITAAAQAKIADWVRAGGLLWMSSEAGLRNEYNEPADLAESLAGLRREWPADGDTNRPPPLTVAPVPGEADFRPHAVDAAFMPERVTWPGARVRAAYSDGRPAWLEKAAGKGRVIYVPHRAGQTYVRDIIRHGEKYWCEAGRELYTAPLREARVPRELELSEPYFMATPLSSTNGTIVTLYNMNPGPVENVRLRLREDRAPVSVECFNGFQLEPLAHAYRDGVLEATLPPFAGSQMIVVRTRPAPPDDRLAVLEARTRKQLESEDPEDLSVGAFVAGYFPAWALGDALAPLLTNDRWEVRRQAAESIGRLGHAPAAKALAARLAVETDAHVFGDGLEALARLGDPAVMALAPRRTEFADPFARRQAAAAARLLLTGPEGTNLVADPARLPADRVAFARRLMNLALEETDIRVKAEGIRLLGLLDPEAALRGALEAHAGPRPEPKSAPHWVRAVADSPVAMAAYLTQGMPGSDSLLLALAAADKRSELVAELGRRLIPAIKAHPEQAAETLTALREPGLARAAFDARQDLPPAFVKQLPRILDAAFQARQGASLEAWSAWLAKEVR